MQEIKSEKSFFIALLFVLSIVGAAIFYQHQAIAAGTTTVSATVATSVTCTAATTTTDFGALNSGSIATSLPNATTTLSCNYGGGCNLLVNDVGNGTSSPGLFAAAATGTALILSGNATLSAGTEGYGIQAATSSAGTGAALAVNAAYLVTGNAVGGLLRTATSIASSTTPTSGRELVSTHKAAISGTTKAGSYSDTITYSCTGQ